jgi:hypothetical protein
MVSDCFLGSRQAAIVSRIDCDVGGVGAPLEARKLRSPAFSLGLEAIGLARSRLPHGGRLFSISMPALIRERGADSPSSE